MDRIEVYDRYGRRVPFAGLSRRQRFKLSAAVLAGAVSLFALILVVAATAFLVAVPLLVLALALVLRTIWRTRRRDRTSPSEEDELPLV